MPQSAFETRTADHAEDLCKAIEAAETVIVTTIERECDALRARCFLAAEALHLRLTDAARIYLGAMRAARSSLAMIEATHPGATAYLDERRSAFSATLQVELAVLAAERAAIEAPGEAGSRSAARQAADGHGLPAAPGPRIRAGWQPNTGLDRSARQSSRM